jgi:hypothetical protein
VAEDFNINPQPKLFGWEGSLLLIILPNPKKGNSWEMMTLTFHDKKESFTIQTNKQEGEWLVAMLKVSNTKTYSFQEVKADFETNLEDFELFWYSKQLTL